jgi:hypothetical protein
MVPAWLHASRTVARIRSLSACGKKEVNGAAGCSKLRRLNYAASSSAYGDAPTLPKSEVMAFNAPISWKAGETRCHDPSAACRVH